MTDDILAVLITIAILSAAFLWVPTLELCGPRCQKFFLARRTRRENAEPMPLEPIEEVAVAALLPSRV